MPRISAHARQQMERRGVSMEQVARVLRTARAFRYYHAGAWKTGYYERSSGLLVAVADDVVMTVITNVTAAYVRRLRSSTPSR